MCNEHVFVWCGTSLFAYISWERQLQCQVSDSESEKPNDFYSINRASHDRGSFLRSLRGSTFSKLREIKSLLGKDFYSYFFLSLADVITVAMEKQVLHDIVGKINIDVFL